jgi:carboxymethylenebutenolidase
VTAKLTAALEHSGKPFMVETYGGVSHGFCVPDTPIYDEAAAEKHWERLLALYAETLRP